MVSILRRRHFVPNPVVMHSTGFRAKRRGPLSIHTWYVFNAQDDSQLEWAASQSASGGGAWMPSSYTIDGGGNFSVGVSGGAGFDFEATLDRANENGQTGLKESEIGSFSSLSVTASGSIAGSGGWSGDNPGGFSVDYYSVGSAGSAALTEVENYSDFDNRLAMTQDLAETLSDNKTANFSAAGGSYSWSATQNTTGQVENGSGTTQMYRENLDDEDGLLLEDAVQLDRKLADRDLIGDFTLDGSESGWASLVETGTYPAPSGGSGGSPSGSDSYHQQLDASTTYVLTQTGTNQTQHYSQGVTETDTTSFHETGTPATGDYTVDGAVTATSVLDRNLSNQTLTAERTGTTSATVNLDKSGNEVTGNFDLTVNSSQSVGLEETQDDQGRSLATDVNESGIGSQENSGNASSGDYSITAGLSNSSGDDSASDVLAPRRSRPTPGPRIRFRTTRAATCTRAATPCTSDSPRRSTPPRP